MKWILFIFLISGAISTKAQHAVVIHNNDLEQLLHLQSDTTYIINFWATWCKPCVEELPGFLETEKNFQDKKFRFIYISLDFKRQLSQVNAWLEKKEMTSEVYLLDEPDYNSWIDKVDPSWQGNIPVTLIFNTAQSFRKFIPHQIEKEELQEVLGL